MLRSSPTFAFVLAELLFIASACYSASMPSRVASSPVDGEESNTPEMAHGTVDVENVFLPAVAVRTFVDYFGIPVRIDCSGVLVGPVNILTAAHCVCAPRAPTPQDKLLVETLLAPLSDAGTMDSAALDVMAVKGIFDRSSSCATESRVTTVVYQEPGAKQFYVAKQYMGRVVINPDLELVIGTKSGNPWVIGNYADLAFIDLPEVVPFAPIGLPTSEVKEGAALAIVGYGPTETGDRVTAGPRRFGGHVVAKFVSSGNGHELIAAAPQPGPDGGVPAHTRMGDSGGPCVREGAPNVLVGISSTRIQSANGSETSYYTSVFPHVGWISERIQQSPRPDAGVSAPQSGAGLDE